MKKGQKLNREDRKHVSVRVPLSLYERMQTLARRMYSSDGSIIIQCLDGYLSELENRPGNGVAERRDSAPLHGARSVKVASDSSDSTASNYVPRMQLPSENVPIRPDVHADFIDGYPDFSPWFGLRELSVAA